MSPEPMGFGDPDTSEQQLVGARPVECFRFEIGTEVHLWTSADQSVDLLTGTYEPEVISRDEVEYSDESGSGSVTVFVPRTSPLLSHLVAPMAEAPVQVWIYRAFRGAEGSAVEYFKGKVTALAVSGSQAALRCSSAMFTLDRRLPCMVYQRQCNRVLGSTGCGVDLEEFQDAITVESVDGRDITSADFQNRPDGWYEGGRLILDGGRARMITLHSGDTVRLIAPFVTAPSVGAVVTAEAGCDRKVTTCRTKFNNALNHMGFSFVPRINPHRSFEGPNGRGSFYGWRG